MGSRWRSTEQKAAQAEHVVKRYSEGAGIREIAGELACSYGTVHAMLTAAAAAGQVVIRTRGAAPRPSADEVAEQVPEPAPEPVAPPPAGRRPVQDVLPGI